MSSEKEIFDELLLRITRAARFPSQHGAAAAADAGDSSGNEKNTRGSSSSSSASQVYRQIAQYFKEASQRRKRSAALAISLDDLHQILRYTAKELHTTLWVSERKKSKQKGGNVPGSADFFYYDSVSDFVRQSPSYSIRALRSGLQREKGASAGKFVLAHCFTEVVELCRAVDVKRDQSRRTILGAIRLTTFVSVAATLWPVVRLPELLEEVARFWSQEEFHSDWTMAVVTFACMATMLANWAALDRTKATALLGISDMVLAATKGQQSHPDGKPGGEAGTRATLVEVVQQALQMPAHSLLLRSYPDAMMAAETTMTEVKEEVQQWYQYSGGEKNGNASASSGSIMAARAGRRTMDKGDDSVADRQRSGLSSVSGEWQNDHPDPLMFPPPVGSGRSSEGRGQQEQQEERDEEEDHDSRSNNGAAPADTIDYDFWSAISSTPQRPMQHH